MSGGAVSGGRIVVDLAAWRHNVRTLAGIAAPAECWIAVKANAYGHGMQPLSVAALEAGASGLAVLEVPAALDLRADGVTARLFAWLHGRDTDYRTAIEGDVELGVSTLGQLRAIAAAATAAGAPARVHLKADTGLHRNGASPEDWPALVAAARDEERAGRIRIEALWSHLADASPEDDAAAIAAFRHAVAVAAQLGVEPPLLHLAASSAGIREPEARFGMVRFGIAAYGISPYDDVDGRGLGLRPVMSLEADVVASDGATSVLGAGAGDGVPPWIRDAEVMLGGRRVPVLDVGVDTMRVGAAAEPGTTAVVFGGEGPSAEEWATWAGTIGDEIVARATRLPRVYRDPRVE